jgi:hypothetical protein
MDPTITDAPVRAMVDPPAVDDAAELLAMAPLHAIVFGFTSSSYVGGAADDAALKSRLETRIRGIPVVITVADNDRWRRLRSLQGIRSTSCRERTIRADLHVMPGERQERQAMARPWRRNWNRREEHATAYERQGHMTEEVWTAFQ